MPNVAKILAYVIAIVVYIWLIALAAGGYENMIGSWKDYSLATFVVGTVSAIGLLVAIYYSA